MSLFAPPVAGEAEAKPPVVIVHDPAAAGALDRLADRPPGEVKGRFAFDTAPDPARFGKQHAGFERTIASTAPRSSPCTR